MCPAQPAPPRRENPLTVLRAAGLVRYDHRGQGNFYRLEPSRIGGVLRQFFGEAEKLGLGDLVLAIKRK